MRTAPDARHPAAGSSASRVVRRSPGRRVRLMNRDVVLAALARMELVRPDEQPPIVPLAGGVSSDILRVDLEDGPICVKRALPRLKVAADWQAPVERNRYEVEWMRIVGGLVPDAVPRILGADPETGMFAMAFLPGKLSGLEGATARRQDRG